MQLQQVYGEIYRVLKPGTYFASYEWVSTKKYDPNNRDHVRIMDEINYGNGLPVSIYLFAHSVADDCLRCLAWMQYSCTVVRNMVDALRSHIPVLCTYRSACVVLMYN